MSKKANPTIIGLFVIGAAVLVIVGIMIFGSGKFVADTTSYILYFEGNVAGLNIGAPAAFKGVKIGSVSDILLHFDSNDMSLRIPVIIDIENDKVEHINGKSSSAARENVILDLVNQGLRAQLKVQSLVTGQLYVEFDFHPEKPVRLVGAEALALDSDLPELPTIPSDIEELQKTLEKIPVEAMISKAINALERIEEVMSSTETAEAMRSLGSTMKNIEALAQTINQKTDTMSADLEGILADSRKLLKDANTLIDNLGTQITPITSGVMKTIKDAQKLVGNVDHQVVPVASEIKNTFKTASGTLKQADKTLVSAEDMIGNDSQLRYELTTTLRELSDAARSIRIFAEYLERHPEALIQGKGD